MPGKKIKILSLNFQTPAASEPTGRFTIAENIPGAVETELASSAPMTVDGILYTPLTTALLDGGKYYKLKCTLSCGSTFVKVIFISDEVCSSPEGMSTELLYVKNAFTGLKVNFIHMLGISNYTFNVYKVAGPGEPGSIFVGSFPITTETGEFIISNAALYENNVNYFGALTFNCNQIEGEVVADLLEWTPQIISNVPSNTYDADEDELTITINTSANVPADIVYEVTHKIDGNTYGPTNVTVTSGTSTGSAVISMTQEDYDNLDAGGLEVVFVNPKLINKTLILN